MKDLYKLLDKIDLQLIKLKTIEFSMVYALIIGIFGVSIYFYVLPMQSKQITSLKSKITTLENAIKSDKEAMKGNDDMSVFLKEAERSNDVIREEIKNNQKALGYIEEKIKEQYNIKFSASQWGKFYEEVQSKAIKNNLNVLNIENDFMKIIVPDLQQQARASGEVLDKNKAKDQAQKIVEEKAKEFRPIFFVKINTVTTFKNLLNFLVDIEQNKLITKLTKLEVNVNDTKTLKTNIEFNLWGIQ